MTTLQIEYLLMKFFDFRQNTIVTGLTTMSGLVGFETDLLMLTKSGYATAVEIKITASDLKRDLKKKHISQFGNPNARSFYFEGIKYFYYAIPIDLLDKAVEQINPAFGIITIDDKRVNVYRPAKSLFPEKWNQKKIENLYRLGMMRIFKLTKQLINR